MTENTALRMALQAQLELLSPLETGISESVTRFHPSDSSIFAYS